MQDDSKRVVRWEQWVAAGFPYPCMLLSACGYGYVQQGAPPAAVPGPPESRPGLVTPHAAGRALVTPLAIAALPGRRPAATSATGRTNNTAILDGFAITAGQANGSGSKGNGGGIVSYAGSPTLAQLVIVGNTAQYGGGMFNYSGSNPDLSNVVFVNNVSVNSGGGMRNYLNCSPTLANVAFVNNTSTESFGGAMSNNQSSPTLTNVVFKNNDAGIGAGSGIHNESSSPTLINVTFNGNAGFSVIYNINSSNQYYVMSLCGAIAPHPKSTASTPAIRRSPTATSRAAAIPAVGTSAPGIFA